MTEILTNTNLNTNDNDITKTITKKGRPFVIYTPEELEARKLKKVKKKLVEKPKYILKQR